MVLDWIKAPNMLKEIDSEIDNSKKEPIDIKQIENLIELINVAKDIGCVFTLKILLEIDNFLLKSDNFKNIKLLKPNKTQESRLVITHTNALLNIDTTIETKYIVGINFDLSFNGDDSTKEGI